MQFSHPLFFLRLLFLPLLPILLPACAVQPPDRNYDEPLARLSAQTELLQQMTARQESGLEQLEQRLIAGISAQQQHQDKQLARLEFRILQNFQGSPDNQDSAPQPAANSRQAADAADSKKMLVGELENITLLPPGASYPARIDTGAETSSIHAEDMAFFERDGKRWIRFTIFAGSEQETALERPVIRMVRILQAVTTESDRRAVVSLQIAMGEHSQQAEFTLTNRRHLEYDILIGRNILKDIFVVDVSRQFVLEPSAAAGS